MPAPPVRLVIQPVIAEEGNKKTANTGWQERRGFRNAKRGRLLKRVEGRKLLREHIFNRLGRIGGIERGRNVYGRPFGECGWREEGRVGRQKAGS